jgi:integrase
MAMAAITAADGDSAGNVQSGKQGGNSVPLIVMGLPRGYTGRQGQYRLGAVQCLSLAFFVDTQHDGPIRRVQVQAHNIAHFFNELWVFGELEVFYAMRLQSESMPDPASAYQPGLRCGMMWRIFLITSRGTPMFLPCERSWRTGVELFRKKNSRYWWYDFVVRGERFRGSTKETKKPAASAKAAQILNQIADGQRPAINKKAPVLGDLAVRFLAYVENSKLAEKSKTYLRSGWKLLSGTEVSTTTGFTGLNKVCDSLDARKRGRFCNIAPLNRPVILKGLTKCNSRMRINHITAEIIDRLEFPGSAYNVNCALKTLRRMLHLAKKQWGLIAMVPEIKLAQEPGRSLRLDDESERKLLLAISQLEHWKPYQQKLLCDVIILIRDTGMRNKKELFRVRIEDIDFPNRAIFIPDSKTATGRRFVPMSDRVLDILFARCGERREGWLFPAPRAKAGHLTTVDKLFREAREKAELPEKLVLYCGRHDFGTELLRRTGNLALVMRIMGQKSLKAAMAYQHPELEQVRSVLNDRNNAGENRPAVN